MNTVDVVSHRDANHLLLCKGAQQIAVRTQCRQPADVAVENGSTLLVRQWELSDGGCRIGAHSLHERWILAQQLRDFVHCISTHERLVKTSIPAPHAIGVAVFHLGLQKPWLLGADDA